MAEGLEYQTTGVLQNNPETSQITDWLPAHIQCH